MLHGMRPYGHHVVEKDGKRILEIDESEPPLYR
jgi:hypothetical protein